MTNAQELKKMLEEEVIPEIEEYMDEIFELIADKKSTKEDEAELEEVRALRDDFREMLEELEADEIDEEECGEIIEELMAMRTGGEE